MPERLETHGFVRAVDEERRRVTVVVSTGDVARDDAVIDQSGWDLRNYERNPVVLWAHNDRELPIARAVSSQVGANELVQVHEFATHPRAEEVWQAVRAGFVNATSVRWYPGETEVRKVGEGKAARTVLVFTRGHELLESSYVPVPADAGCLVLRAEGGRVDAGAYAREGEEAAAVTAETEQSPWQRFAAGFTKCASEEAQR
jgi:phage head maturation protease